MCDNRVFKLNGGVHYDNMQQLSIQSQKKNLWHYLVRLTVIFLGLLAAFVIIIMLYLILPVIPDPIPGFVTRKGKLIATHELKQNVVAGATIVETRLISSSGLQVDINVRRQSEVNSPQPLIVILGGLRTGNRAVELINRSTNITIAAISYPHHADLNAKGFALMMQIPELQQALLDTTPAVFLALDYLVKQPYVDLNNIELVGVSLGAFMVSAPGALDSRFRRVWLIHGAAEPRSVIEHQLKNKIHFAPLRKLTALFLEVITASNHLRPEKWLGRISPRPVIIVNAINDAAYPASSVTALHNILGNTSEVIWTKGKHITPRQTEVIEELIDLVVERINKTQNFPTIPDKQSEP